MYRKTDRVLDVHCLVEHSKQPDTKAAKTNKKCVQWDERRAERTKIWIKLKNNSVTYASCEDDNEDQDLVQFSLEQDRSITKDDTMTSCQANQT